VSNKYLIVGGVAGGARLRRLGEDDEIIMFEKGPDVSFSNCSLPYRLSGEVANIGLRAYEYFTDMTKNRKPIIDKYVFKYGVVEKDPA